MTGERKRASNQDIRNGFVICHAGLEMGPLTPASQRTPGDEQTRIALFLNHFLIVLSIGNAVISAMSVGASDLDISVFLAQAAQFAILLGMLWMIRRGYVRAVSIVLVFCTWLAATMAVWLDGGVQSPKMGMFLMVLILSALLFRSRALWFVFALSISTMLSILQAQLAGALPERFEPPEISFISHIVILVSATLFLHLGVQSLQRAREQAKRHQELADLERLRADELLHNILPIKVAEQLKHRIHPIAERFDKATVLFADLVDFTEFCASHPPEEVVVLLNEIFTRFDALAERHRLEKIKTIGDAYMVVGGVPTARADHVLAASEMALEMRSEFADFASKRGLKLGLRIGIHTGPVVAGVIGRRKFIYDLWGDTVNTASRMESSGIDGEIQISDAVAAEVAGHYDSIFRGVIAIKGKGEMPVFLLKGRRSIS